MKYNLLMSYCTFLSFYLLLKVEGRPVEGHPVIGKLTHIKTLFEKLKPLDQKLQYQVDKMANMTEAASKGAMAHKPNLKDLEMASEDGDSDGDAAGSDEDLGSAAEEGESDIEDDMGESGAGSAEGASDDSDGSSDAKPKKGVKGSDVYKAPKLNAVTFEDAKDKKKRQKEEY